MKLEIEKIKEQIKQIKEIANATDSKNKKENSKRIKELRAQIRILKAEYREARARDYAEPRNINVNIKTSKNRKDKIRLYFGSITNFTHKLWDKAIMEHEKTLS